MSSCAERGHPDGNGQRRLPPTPVERDRRALRRALAAAAAAAVGVGGLLAAGLAPAGGAAVAAGVLLGVACGAMLGALWSAIGIGLDIFADHQPGRRRLVWTAVLTAFAFVTTGLALAAGVAV